MIRSWPDLTAMEGEAGSRTMEIGCYWKQNWRRCALCCVPHVTSIIPAWWTNLNIWVVCIWILYVYLWICFVCVFVLLRTKWSRRRSQVCNSQCVNQFLSFNCSLWFQQSSTNPPISWSLPQTKQPEKYLQISIGKSRRAAKRAARQEERVINFPFQINLWSGKLAFPGWSLLLLCSWFGRHQFDQ